VRDTRDQVRCQRCYSPASGGPRDPTELPDDDVGFSTAATKQPEAATNPTDKTKQHFGRFAKTEIAWGCKP